jgi:hypothetical protein
LTSSHRFGDDHPVDDRRSAARWLDWLFGWAFPVLLVVVAAVADLGFGTCFSSDCPNGSHPTASRVVVATVVLFVIWVLARFAHLVATAREGRDRGS